MFCQVDIDLFNSSFCLISRVNVGDVHKKWNENQKTNEKKETNNSNGSKMIKLMSDLRAFKETRNVDFCIQNIKNKLKLKFQKKKA